MEMRNLFEGCSMGGATQNPCMIYDSPTMKVLNVKLDEGQQLFLDSERMDGTVSLLAMEGHGELFGFEEDNLQLKAGDIVISRMNEPHTLTARTALRLLLTIIPPAAI
jgi:hypothetical protein